MRRMVSRRQFLSAMAASYPLLGAARSWAAPARRPNIILIMADDMGYSDLGCYGSEIHTPTLDGMAKRGIRFTQFYNTPRCCPSRASLLTGLYPHQAGIGHMVGNYGIPAYQGFLNGRCVTIAEALRPAGYRTLMSGKWHVGESRPHWPTDRGFDHYYGLISGGSNYWKLDRGRKMAIDDKPHTPDPKGFYITDAFTDHAVEFIDKHGRNERPFFLYVAYTAPHWPLHAHPSDIAKYRGKYLEGWDALRQERHKRQIGLGLVDAKWPLTPRDHSAPAWDTVKDKAALDLKMAVYAAQIDRMDQGIGRILAKLRDIGEEGNTLVMFLVDNGGCAEQINRGKPGVPAGPVDSFLSYGLPWANASNTPFRRYKHWVHEGGIASPFIVQWPAVITRGGQLTRQVGHSIDIMATCLDVAGAAYPTTHKGKPILPLEGKSLLPIFEGKTRAPHDVLTWEHEGNRAVRQGKWKLVSRHPGGWELYDLEADRTELNNLATQHPDKAKELAALYAAWATRCGVEPWPIRGRRGARRRTRPGVQFHLTFADGADAKVANDRSGNKRHFDIIGTKPVTDAGREARLFDGKGDYLDLPLESTPDPKGRPIAILAWVKPSAPNGVILAHGGSGTGYALALRDGKPVFTVRDSRKPTSVAADQPLPSGWAHLAGTLAKDGTMRLFVNGKPAASGKRPGLLSRCPGENLQVGTDRNTHAGEYATHNPFAGLLADLKLLYAPLTDAQIAAEAK